MTRDQIQSLGLEKIRKMSRLMIVGYAVIVIAAIIGITAFIVSKYDGLTRNKVGSMTSTLNVQLKLNLESYLSRMETIGTLAYSVDNAYTYDATDTSMDEYDAINIEKQISADLSSLCLMENFVDYGIVYANNKTIGKISNGTIKLFGDQLYSQLSTMISRKRTHDGWFTGYKNDYERIYYVKQMKENVLFVISFYTAELDTVFDNPETLSDMEIRLTDRGYRTIYSSVKNDVCGNIIPANLLTDIKDKDSVIINGSENLSTVNAINDDWYIICSIPTNVILKEAIEIRKFIYLFAGIVALIAVMAGAVFVKRMADPIGTVTAGLSEEISEDGYEKILGRRFFRDKADNLMKKDPETAYSVILVAINDFSRIVEKFDTEFADKQKDKMVDTLREIFPDAECIGRVGENSFSVLMKNVDNTEDAFRMFSESRGTDVCEMFRQSEYTNTMGVFDLTASSSAAVGKGDFHSTFYKAYTTLCDSVNMNHDASDLM